MSGTSPKCSLCGLTWACRAHASSGMGAPWKVAPQYTPPSPCQYDYVGHHEAGQLHDGWHRVVREGSEERDRGVCVGGRGT
mmetsp:Transcript_109258/g.185532  ORF Transcript_109258/g.185532 Transcript_109258/m.185532 type:complete len:81 (+) Transcript_109258:1337-1579(+)